MSNLGARHQKMESGTRGLKFLMRSLSLINILAVRTKSVCVKFYYSVSICIAFVLWYKKSICVVLLQQLVCTSFSGPARGAKIWGCTIVLPACHAKNSRGFHYLFLLKNWRCTCTLFILLPPVLIFLTLQIILGRVHINKKTTFT